MPLLPASTLKREMWKNGLGSTLVVASDASAVDGETWTWRLAIADIPSRSPFSYFPGVDRCIALLEGAGLAIERGGRRQDLPAVGSALAFAGEEEVVGEPTGDGVRDVNLMLRRDHWQGEMQLVRAENARVCAACVIVHASNGALEVSSIAEPSITRIESDETLITHGAVEVRPLAMACAIICTMRPAAIPLAEAMRVWAYIGVNSFGGPTAQIAVMHRVLVDERRWITDERFLHALNYCMLLPGPEAMQLATYVGWLKHRTLGGLIAGILFVLPGFLSILALSIAYTSFYDITVVAGMLFGLRAAILAIVAHAMIRIGKRVLKSPISYAVAALSFIAIAFADAPFPLIIVAAAIIGIIGARCWPAQFNAPAASATDSVVMPDHTKPTLARALTVLAVWVPLWLVPIALLAAVLGPDDLFTQQAWFFSKVAVVTFGGAYSVLAYIAQQAVEVHHWVTPAEILIGLGLAETTPGPLIQVVQFVGYIGAYRYPGNLHPLVAAVLASLLVTWVTYVPCFLWIFLGAPFIERVRGNNALRAALSTITAAVVGVICTLSIWLGANTLLHTSAGATALDWPALAIAAIAGLVIFRWNWSILRTIALSVMLGTAITSLR